MVVQSLTRRQTQAWCRHNPQHPSQFAGTGAFNRGAPMPTPEEQARQRIDQLLEETGWQVQDRNPRGPFLYRSTELAGQTCSARARLGQ